MRVLQLGLIKKCCNIQNKLNTYLIISFVSLELNQVLKVLLFSFYSVLCPWVLSRSFNSYFLQCTVSKELFQVCQILLFKVYYLHGAIPGLLNLTVYSVLCTQLFQDLKSYCLQFTVSLELLQVYQILLFKVHSVHGAVPGLSNLTFYSVLCLWSCSRSFKL